jgi:hypothetical protein
LMDEGIRTLHERCCRLYATHVGVLARDVTAADCGSGPR